MNCRCEKPNQGSNPRNEGSCIKCGRPVNPEALLSDAVTRNAYDRIESHFPGKVPESYLAFRSQCEAREKEGRRKFGLQYLWRRNRRESLEEFADGSNYVLFDHLQVINWIGEDRDEDRVYQIMYRCWQLYDEVRALSLARRGSP